MIRLTSVTRTFGEGDDERAAVRDVSFELPPGTLTLLTGPSGSGKSTLLALVAGLLRPTSGDVEVLDVRPGRLPDSLGAPFRRRRLGLVFQHLHLVPDMTALENVLAPLVPDGGRLRDLEARARAALARCGAEELAPALARSLSGGQQQRVAIARALVHDPPVLLADEPTTHLDVALKADVVALLAGLRDDRRTILVASHDPALVDAPVVDRVLTLRHGTLVADVRR